MITSVQWSATVVAAVVLLLAVPHVSTAGCRSRPTGRSAGKRPLIINVPRQDQVKPLCPQQPRSTCEGSGSVRLVIKDSPDDQQDLLAWRWGKDASADVGDPSTMGNFALCVYDSFENVSLRVASLTVEPGGRRTRHASGASKYNDPRGASAGATHLTLRNAATGRTTMKVKATGKRLRLPPPAGRSRFFHKNGSVVVQLVHSGSDRCWTSTFTTARENSAGSFVAP